MRSNNTRFCFLLSLLVFAASSVPVLAARRGKSSPTPPKETVAASESSGGLRYTIVLGKFDYAAGYRYRWNHPESVPAAASAMLRVALEQSGRFVVLADSKLIAELEKELVLAGNPERTQQGSRNPKKGHFTAAQLLVKGTVTHVQDNVGGSDVSLRSLPILGGSGIVGSQQAEINMTFEILDIQTRQIKSTIQVVGRSKRSRLGIGGLPWFGASFDVYKNDNVGLAISDAIDQAVQELIKQLDDIQWYAHVVLVKRDGTIVMNRGAREGVTRGQEFVVGRSELLLDPDTGEVLYEDLTPVGRLTVVDVKDKVSFCKAHDTSGPIEKYMTIHVPESD